MKKLIAAVALAAAGLANSADPQFDQYGQTYGFDHVDVGLGVPLKVRFVDGDLEDAYGSNAAGSILASAITAGVWRSDLLSLVHTYGALWLSANISWKDANYLRGCWDYCTIRALDAVGRYDTDNGYTVSATWITANEHGVNAGGYYHGYHRWSHFTTSTVGLNSTIAVWDAQ